MGAVLLSHAYHLPFVFLNVFVFSSSLDWQFASLYQPGFSGTFYNHLQYY
jgi:hypothetical protein